MAELQLIASKTEQFLVFDGKLLHKNAFPKKGTITADHAVLVAGVVRANLTDAQCETIIDRMTKVKRVFKSRVEHYAQNLCVKNAQKIGMTLRSGGPVQTYTDILEELESNSTMRSFQNWFHIYYRDFDVRGSGKGEAEASIMNELKIRYKDGNVSGGCMGELFMDVLSKLLENVQKRSREKQGLHVTKSRPGKESLGDKRRVSGDYFIIRSDKKKNVIDWTPFNVSTPWCFLVLVKDSNECLFLAIGKAD
jgi:hypothetical protein